MAFPARKPNETDEEYNKRTGAPHPAPSEWAERNDRSHRNAGETDLAWGKRVGATVPPRNPGESTTDFDARVNAL